MLGPILNGDVVSLEPVRPEDLPLINTWWALQQVTRFWSGEGVPSMTQTEEWFERSARSDDDVVWTIRVDGKTIGHTHLTSIDWQNRSASSGLLIGEVKAWGKGHAGEAVRLRTQYAFEELGLERLESESVEGNVAMHRALEKVGYRKIGRKRHALYRGGAWHDAFLFELLRDEWSGRAILDDTQRVPRRYTNCGGEGSLPGRGNINHSLTYSVDYSE